MSAGDTAAVASCRAAVECEDVYIWGFENGHVCVCVCVGVGLIVCSRSRATDRTTTKDPTEWCIRYISN